MLSSELPMTPDPSHEPDVPGTDDSGPAHSRSPAKRMQRRVLLRGFALVLFVGMVVFVPLGEKLLLEKAYALAIVGTATLLLLLATARVSFALITVSLLAITLATASMFKLEFLLTPVLAPDLKYYINLESLDWLVRYPMLMVSTIAAVVLIPGMLLLAWKWDRVADNWKWNNRRALGLRLMGSLAAILLFAICLSPRGPFSGVFNKPMWATITDRSYMTAFFTSFSDTEVHIPQRVGKVGSSISWKLDTPLRAPQRRPDVVAVLEESTFDPGILKPCTLPECKLPMFQADNFTRANGPLIVHTFGGGTWTSEFALETGLADVLFGNAGLYATYSLAPLVKYSLPRAFKAAGYRVIAVYSHSGEFLNARNAYANYGFDMFYDGTDLGLGWDSTDEDLFEAFRQIYSDETEAHPDQPLFIFTLTLHQHGPHMDPLDTLPPPYDKPLFAGKFKPAALDTWLNLNLGNYLYRAKLSSAMLDKMQAMLWSSGRPTVLMHFGDHQPSFDGAIHAIPKTVPKAAGQNSSRVTYFKLQTSYPMPKLPRYEAMDIIYLGTLLLEAAGVPKDAYYQANTVMRDHCAGRYLNCKDRDMLAAYHDFLFYDLKVLKDE